MVRARYFLVALVIAALLWLAAHGASPIERSFDLPLVFQSVPEDLVIVEQNTGAVLDLCHRGIVLAEGRAVLTGTAADLADRRTILDSYLGQRLLDEP